MLLPSPCTPSCHLLHLLCRPSLSNNLLRLWSCLVNQSPHFPPHARCLRRTHAPLSPVPSTASSLSLSFAIRHRLCSAVKLISLFISLPTYVPAAALYTFAPVLSPCTPTSFPFHFVFPSLWLRMHLLVPFTGLLHLASTLFHHLASPYKNLPPCMSSLFLFL